MVTSRKTRHILHLMHDDVLLRPNLPLPTLERDELASLSQLVQDAWTAAPDWHWFPDDELALRALPIYSFQGDVCFELKKSQLPGVVRTYLYERVRGLLIVQGGHSVEYGSETDSSKPEETFTDAALRIIAAYEQGPADPDLVRRVEFHDSLAPSHAPRYTTVSDLAHRVVAHWFGPMVKIWAWYKRFCFTLVGSITFFLFWTAYVAGSGVFDSPEEFNLVTVIFLVISIVGPLWFAGITAWKNLSYGPVRLFLSGFLLPYFVWTLVAIMYARPIPDFVGTRESTPDVRSIPPAPPVLPAPPLSDLLEPETTPPQSSGQSS